ncbi:MAG: DNA photolyase [Gammaproteobacteria bacterium]|nr:DNA photolyase [Gammaproteobacteria bacterium]
MIETVYIEREVLDHPRTARVLARVRPRHVITCERYGEVFNRHNQNFRVQKAHPALILAAKHGRRLLPVPGGYGFTAEPAFYFSHMLNCLYDCRYCFLQGMFRSAHYVLFVNYEDFIADIEAECARSDAPRWLFSGYDCDSLALEPVTGFAATFIDACAKLPNAWLELRSKSTQIRSLLNRPPVARCVCAFSLSPSAVVDAFEQRTPSLAARLAAIKRLQAHGWPIGLRFDPLLPVADFEAVHRAFFNQVFAELDATKLHSVTVGVLRLPRDQARNIARLYPDEGLFALAETERDGLVSYGADTDALLDWCSAELARRIPAQRIHRQAA